MTPKVAHMKAPKTAFIFEKYKLIGSGKLFLSSIGIFHIAPAEPRSFILLEEACDYARGEDWELVPLPVDEGCTVDWRDRSDAAWVKVRKLMSAGLSMTRFYLG